MQTQEVEADIVVSLNDSQYQLCKAMSDMKEEDPLKEDCKRIRLQLVLGINQLRSILGTLKEQSDHTVKKELAEWIKFMSKLHK